MKTRACTKCGDTKSLDMFGLDKRGKYGHKSWCNPCVAKYVKERRHILHPERKYKFDAYTGCPDGSKRCSVCKEVKPLTDFHIDNSGRHKCNHQCKCIECAAKYHILNSEHNCGKARAWGKDNKERANATSLNWARSNPEKRKAISNRYNSKHPESGRKQARRRRAKKAAINEAFDADMDLFVRKFWGGRCAVCGKTKEDEGRAIAIDHWLPLSKGHALTVNNATLLCTSCNSRKGNRPAAMVFGVEIADRIEHKIKKQVKAWEKQAVAV